MKIAIIDYGAGNIKSVQFALERMGYSGFLTSDATEISAADKVIFPGVGEAQTAMNALKEKGLDKLIPQIKQDVLGICLGMQLMCRKSEEGNTDCLDIFPMESLEFPEPLKIPHVGWNELEQTSSKLFTGIEPGAFAYFVHSFYVPMSEFTVAESEYGFPFSAALVKDNFYACQFHPEKSSKTGEQILKNFLKL
jgi:glutamine amidotransferase